MFTGDGRPRRVSPYVGRAWALPDGIHEAADGFRVEKDRKMAVLSPVDFPLDHVGHVLVYPKLVDVQKFIDASKGLRNDGPSADFPGAVGVISLLHASDGLHVSGVQACFKTGAGEPPLAKSRESHYLSWRMRALREAILLAWRCRQPLVFSKFERHAESGGGARHFRKPGAGGPPTAFERELSHVASRLGVRVIDEGDYLVVPQPRLPAERKAGSK